MPAAMRTFLNKIGALLLAALLATAALPVGAHAAAKSRKEKKKSETPAPEKKLSAYEKLFKDKESRTAEGLFKLHIIDGKLYTEIPLDILEREFVINTTIEASSLADYGLAGQQPLPPYHITFSRRDSLVRMHEVPRRTLSDSDAGIARALELSSTMPIVASYPIKAYNADSTAVVIENTALFMSDNEHLKAFEARGMSPLHISRASYKADRSLLRDVEGGKDYASVISDMTYGVTTQYFIFIICKDKPFTARARRTITMLPEECAPTRIADPRIGVLPVPFTRFTAEQGTRPAYFASRINFRPGGEIRPVTFYIDTLFTPAWQRGIRRGIALWNEAFRRIGMGDVLKAEVYPAEGFDSNSPGRFYVKYVASTNPKMTVNLSTDPRSGEITGGCIHLPESLLDEIRLRRFIDLSAADPAARDMMLDDEELASSLAVHTARGVAQLLGLATNYAAAAAYPTDSLRSAAFTRENGLCSSITALNDYNYLAQPGDKGVRLVNDCLGKYDYFAVRWLYGDIAGAKTPAEEQKALSEMLREKAGDPAYYYGNYWYDYYFGDVRLAGRRSREAHPLPFRESAHRRTTCSGVARRARCGRQLPRRSHCGALAGCPGGDFLHGGLHRRRLLHRSHGRRRANDASRRAERGAAALCEGDAESHRGPLVARHEAHRRPAGQPPAVGADGLPGNADETHGNPAPLPERTVGSLHAGRNGGGHGRLHLPRRKGGMQTVRLQPAASTGIYGCGHRRLESARRAENRTRPGLGVRCGQGSHAARIPLRSHGDAGSDQRIRQIPHDVLRQGFLGARLLRHAAATPRHLSPGRRRSVGCLLAGLLPLHAPQDRELAESGLIPGRTPLGTKARSVPRLLSYTSANFRRR